MKHSLIRLDEYVNDVNPMQQYSLSAHFLFFIFTAMGDFGACCSGIRLHDIFCLLGPTRRSQGHTLAKRDIYITSQPIIA